MERTGKKQGENRVRTKRKCPYVVGEPCTGFRKSYCKILFL
jgi:hypothetical protein